MNIIGLVTSNGKVIIENIYLDRGLETTLYMNFCTRQLEHGCDCLITKDGDSLKVIKLTKPSTKRLRTGA